MHFARSGSLDRRGLELRVGSGRLVWIYTPTYSNCLINNVFHKQVAYLGKLPTKTPKCVNLSIVYNVTTNTSLIL